MVPTELWGAAGVGRDMRAGTGMRAAGGQGRGRGRACVATRVRKVGRLPGGVRRS